MASLDASEVAKLLAEYGRRTALAGGNPYRSKAYLRAARGLDRNGGDRRSLTVWRCDAMRSAT